MKDLTIMIDNRPGALAEMGEVLGKAVCALCRKLQRLLP